MPRTGQKLRPRKYHLTLFGYWLELLNEVFQTNQMELAEMTGLDQSTISKAKRDRSPRLDTVERLWQAYNELAKRQQREVLTEDCEEGFFAAAWHMTPRQREASQQCLHAMQAHVPMPDGGVIHEIEIRLFHEEKIMERE